MAGTDDAGLRRAGWLGNRPLLIALLFLATVAGIGVVVVQETSSGDSGLPEEIERYLAAWTAGDFAAMQRLVVEPPDDFVTAHQQMHASLFISQARFDAGEGEFARGEGAVPVEARFALGGLGVWEYDITLRLERVDGDWRVRWTPATLHPDLAPGMRFARTRSTPPRAPLTDRNGLPLTDTVLPSIVGSVAPANAEQAAELGPEHQAGDVVGQGGL